METFLIKTLQLILSLSILVIVHEMGHFLFARLFKTRVEKFCLFFDPWFTLFKFKPKHSDTEYGLGWLPLGGYVKIAGMIDESLDTEQLKKPVQPWEFRAKPAWQRLLIMTGGVLFNFLLAIVIYAMILFAWGDTYIPVQKAPLGMEYNEAMHRAGFQDGDVLLSADGVPLERMDGDLLMAIVDALDYLPQDQPGRDKIITILQGIVKNLAKYQDPQTGAWCQVIDQTGREGNYLEMSCTPMYAYAIAKGVRKGYLDPSTLEMAKKAYQGILDNFIKVDEKGLVSLTRVCGVAGLGGKPYRDGSFEYYINEVIRDNDPKGVAPFIMLCIEMND